MMWEKLNAVYDSLVSVVAKMVAPLTQGRFVWMLEEKEDKKDRQREKTS